MHLTLVPNLTGMEPKLEQRRGTVLIVEDDNDIRAVLKEILENEKYEVATASNGHEAMVWLKQSLRDPCIILLDLMMPVMSGWDVIALLQEGDRLITIPVLVLSASHIHDAPKGIVGFIKKPVGYVQLMDVIVRFCTTKD